ncbi:hypothetical protein Aduo_019165 [Ancylostoma duodenale]
MSALRSEIRVTLLYELKLDHTAAQARRNICKALGDGALSETTARTWLAKFRQGEGELEGKPRSVATKQIDYDVDLRIEANPTASTRMLASTFSYSHMQVARIVHDGGKKIRHGKWVPHDLTRSQKRTACGGRKFSA